MRIRMKISRQPKRCDAKTWVMHSLKVIVLFPLGASVITLGAMEVERKVSDKDKWKRKKYMGLCSVGSAKVTRMMRLFPSRVTR